MDPSIIFPPARIISEAAHEMHPQCIQQVFELRRFKNRQSILQERSESKKVSLSVLSVGNSAGN